MSVLMNCLIYQFANDHHQMHWLKSRHAFILLRKREASKRLAKPSRDEIAKCREILADVDIKVCGICFKEDDNEYLNSHVE